MTKKITVKEEGVTISEGVRVLNFIGTGVTASGSGSVASITVSGGGGGGASLPPTDIFVSTNDGDDGNDGLTPGTAFATLTKAINTVGEAAPANYAPIIHIASGTYNAEQLQGVTWPALTRESSGIIFWGDGGGQPGDDGCHQQDSGTLSGISDFESFGDNNEVTVDFTLDPANKGYTLEITSGANAGQRRTIIDISGNNIIVAYGFSNSQSSGNCRVFNPGVIIDDVDEYPNIRRQFRMMPLAYSHGFSTNWDSQEFQFSSEPAPSTPATVWVNVELTNTANNQITEFFFAGGQACLFGVVGGDVTRLDLQSLFIGSTTSLLPQNTSVTFNPAPTLQPLSNAVTNIAKKWNGWGYRGGLKTTHVGRMVTSAFYADESITLQGLRLSNLKGIYSLSSLSVSNCIVNISDSFIDGNFAASGSFCELSNTTTLLGTVSGEENSHVLCAALLIVGPNETAASATLGSKIFLDMTNIGGDRRVQVSGGAGSAIPAGDDVSPGTAVLTVAVDQLISYFTDANMSIMGSDGSIVMATAVDGGF